MQPVNMALWIRGGAPSTFGNPLTAIAAAVVVYRHEAAQGSSRQPPLRTQDENSLPANTGVHGGSGIPAIEPTEALREQ